MIEILYSILQSAAPHLGEALGIAIGNYISSFWDAPGLSSDIKEDERYVDAVQTYEKHASSANISDLESLQAKQEFSRQLYELIGEWQASSNRAKLTEVQTSWDKDNWFSKLDRQETYQILNQQEHRLLILSSPPEISPDCPKSFINNLKTEVRNGASSFLNQAYSNHSLCSLEFYGDYFKEPISAIDVKRLQNVLGSIPTAVIYSEITDYQVSFHIGFWGLKENAIVQFDMPPWSWEKSYEGLKDLGLSSIQALREIRQLIVAAYSLFASFIADWYYLSINPFYEPQLYRISQFSFNFGLQEKLIEPYIKILKEAQKSHQALYTENQKLISEPTDIFNGLEVALQLKNWKEADRRTKIILLQLADKNEGDYLLEKDIKKISCYDLQKIDCLWQEHSNSRFGFSAQYKIWLASQKNLDKFGETVGWKNVRWLAFSELTFSSSALHGHFPRSWMTKSFTQLSLLFSRLEECQIVQKTYNHSPTSNT